MQVLQTDPVQYYTEVIIFFFPGTTAIYCYLFEIVNTKVLLLLWLLSLICCTTLSVSVSRPVPLDWFVSVSCHTGYFCLSLRVVLDLVRIVESIRNWIVAHLYRRPNFIIHVSDNFFSISINTALSIEWDENIRHNAVTQCWSYNNNTNNHDKTKHRLIRLLLQPQYLST